MDPNQLDSAEMTEQLSKASCSSGGDLSKVILSVVFNPPEDSLRKYNRLYKGLGMDGLT